MMRLPHKISIVDVIRPHSRKELHRLVTFGITFKKSPFHIVYISGAANTELEALDAVLEAQFKAGWYPKRWSEFWRKKSDDVSTRIAVLYD